MGEQKQAYKAGCPDGNIAWLDLGMDPFELVEGEKWEELISYAEENMELLTRKVLSGDKKALADTVETGAIFLNIVETLLNSGPLMSWALFSIGKLKGAINLLARELSHESQKREAEIVAEENLSCIKHLDGIILALKRSGSLTHSCLAEQMGNMKATTLTENMKKIAQYGLVNSKKVGKYKNYSLTDIGLLYAEKVMMRMEQPADLDNIRKTLQQLLNNDTTKSPTKYMMKQLLLEKAGSLIESEKTDNLQEHDNNARTAIFAKGDGFLGPLKTDSLEKDSSPEWTRRSGFGMSSLRIASFERNEMTVGSLGRVFTRENMKSPVSGQIITTKNVIMKGAEEDILKDEDIDDYRRMEDKKELSYTEQNLFVGGYETKQAIYYRRRRGQGAKHPYNNQMYRRKNTIPKMQSVLN